MGSLYSGLVVAEGNSKIKHEVQRLRSVLIKPLQQVSRFGFYLTYTFYPEFFIVHEIDDNNNIVRRFIEIPKIFYDEDSFNTNQVIFKSGLELFGAIDCSYRTFSLSDKSFLQIPLKEHNAQKLRTLSKPLNKYLSNKKKDNRKVESHKNMKEFDITDDQFWKKADYETRLIIIMMLTGAFGYPKKNCSRTHRLL